MTDDNLGTVRCIIEVTAGVIPFHRDPEYTRRYVITSDEWLGLRDPEKQHGLLAERNGQAFGYAGMLSLMPHRLNWVRVDWLWL